MAVSQLPQAPYRQDRKLFPTPLIGDVLFSEVRDCNRGNPFPEYGTPHPNADRWPDHKLVFIKPVDIERNEIFEFFYAADRENQDLYNFSSGYRNVVGNAGGREFRVVQRSYITLRENFQPRNIPFGTSMPNVPEGKFDDVEYVFFDRQQQRIDQQELDSLYVAEVHTYIERAFLDEKLSFTAQRTDPLPEKFQILVPEQVTEELVEGKAEMPMLTGGQLSVKEDQINPDIKLVRRSTRDRSTLPKSLSQKSTTNEKQLASVTETVQSGDTAEQPTATTDIQSEALGDGTYVVRKVEVPEVFASEAFSTQRPDVVPEKFRALIPTKSEEETVEGNAEMPTLATGELESSEQQINKFVKRKRTIKRDATTLPKSLSQKSTTNEKQLATVTETIQSGDTSELATATTDIQSEALGDGTYVVRKVEVPEVFASEAFSTQRPDVVPEKFRALIPTKSEEETVEGNAEMPTLATGELESSEQQINKFVKRKRTIKRDATTLPKSLSQKSTTNEKQLATVTETLQTGDTTEVPTATVDIQSEALGDGTYIVRKVEVPEIFEQPEFTIQKPDTIPEKFRTEIPTEITSINKQGVASQPALVSGELQKSSQQLNEFIYREQTIKRNVTNQVAMPDGKRSYVEGTLATVKESLSTSPNIESGLLVSESQSTAIGDGKFIVQTVKVSEWPELKSSEWNNELNSQVVRTERFIAPPSSFNNANTSYRAINKDRTLEVVETEPTQALTNYVMSFPIQVDVQLPDVLKSISVVWSEDAAQGFYDSNWSGSSSGTSYSLSGSESASSESSASIKPELIIDIERPWGADTSATAYYFFVKGSNNIISESNFLSKLSSVVGSTVSRWPSFKPVSHTLVLTGGSAQVQAKVNWNASRSGSSSTSTTDKTAGQGTSYALGTSLNAVTIPPTIHGAIDISGAEQKTKSVLATCSSGTGPTSNFPFVLTTATAMHNLTADVNPKSLSATSPAQIPTSGKYVVKSEVAPYKWGWARCYAVVLDASVLAGQP